MPVTVERSAAIRRGGGGAPGAGDARVGGKLRMRDLLVGEGTALSDGSGSRTGSRKGDGVGQGAYDALGYEERAPLLPLFEALWARLDGALDYPRELVESRVEGVVALRFTVDERGALASDVTRVQASSTLLEAYVLSVVCACLEKGFEGPRRARRSRTPVQLVVDFATSPDEQLPSRERGGVRGNALTVVRRRWRPSVLEEAVERVFTRYVPPVLPLPGGFYVDVVRLIAFLDGLDALDPETLRRVRLDGFRRRFLRATR